MNLRKVFCIIEQLSIKGTFPLPGVIYKVRSFIIPFWDKKYNISIQIL